MAKPQWIDIKENMLAKRLANIQELEFQYKKARMREAWQNPSGISRFAASKIILRDMESSLKIALEAQDTITLNYPEESRDYVEETVSLPGFEVAKMVLEKIREKRDRKTNLQIARRLAVYDVKLKETQNTYEKLDAEKQRMREELLKRMEAYKEHEAEINRFSTPVPTMEQLTPPTKKEEEENGA